MREKTIEDTEQATWYACLAFGIYQEKETVPQPKTKKSEAGFYVGRSRYRGGQLEHVEARIEVIKRSI